MENQKIYYKALASCMQNAYVFFFTLGIYFVYIPWNLERLDLVETDLGLWLFIFGIVNLITNQFTGRIIVPKIGTKNIVIIGIGQTVMSAANNSFCANSDLPLVMDLSPDLPIREQFSPYYDSHALVILDLLMISIFESMSWIDYLQGISVLGIV